MKMISLLLPALATGILGCTSTNPRVVTRLNEDASVTAKLPFNPLGDKVITSWIDRKSGTMSTLYGNAPAIQYARSHAGNAYPDGSVLSLVTWAQQEDPRWFGGNIPAHARSIEFVTVNGTTYGYESYSGQPLNRTTAEAGPTPNDRSSYLLGQRAAVMP